MKRTFVVILFFLFLGLLGVMAGEPKRILEQAIQTCYSCIGIG